MDYSERTIYQEQYKIDMLSINKKTNVDTISSIYKNECKIFYNMFVI